MFSFSNSTYNTGCNEALSYFFWFEFCSAEFTAEEGRAHQQTAGTIIRNMQREIWLCIGMHACINIKQNCHCLVNMVIEKVCRREHC